MFLAHPAGRAGATDGRRELGQTATRARRPRRRRGHLPLGAWGASRTSRDVAQPRRCVTGAKPGVGSHRRLRGIHRRRTAKSGRPVQPRDRRVGCRQLERRLAALRSALADRQHTLRAEAPRRPPLERRAARRQNATALCRAGIWRHAAVLPLRVELGQRRCERRDRVPSRTARPPANAPRCVAGFRAG